MILSCSGLAKTYAAERGPVDALRAVDFEASAGEFASIVGRSGSGKSTLLAMMGGLSRPSSGSVRVEDVAIWSLSDDRLADFRNRRIGYVYQFSSLIPTLRVLDNVALPALIRSARETDAAYTRAQALLDQFGLAYCVSAYPPELSSGEQRRVVIARALINDPVLLLADEPTSDLDEETERQIVDWFRALNRERALTVVMVTHNLRLAEETDRVIHIADGRLAA